MLALIQRVAQASVMVDQQTVGEIDHGLLVFVCAQPNDTTEIVDKCLQKILALRIFDDAQGRLNKNIQQVNGGLLIVSQCTLAADTRRGNRPGFSQAASPQLAENLYDYMVRTAQVRHPKVASGRFAANMQVHLVNDGPITIPLEITGN